MHRGMVLCAAVAAVASAVSAADDAALRAAVDGIRKDYEAMVAARDRMARDLDARWRDEEAKEPGWQATLTLANGMLRRPVTMKFTRIGGRWVNAVARFPGYNGCECPINASGLTCQGGALKGQVKVTIVSDGWVPPPGETYDLVFDLDATVRRSAVSGTYRSGGNTELSRSVPADQEKYDALVREVKENPKAAPMLTVADEWPTAEWGQKAARLLKQLETIRPAP